MKYPRQRRKAIRAAKNSTDQIAQLTGVTAASVVTLRAENVNGDGMTGDVPFGFLTDAVDGDRTVDRPDATQIKSDRNQAVTDVNFRDDIDVSGVIDNPDYKALMANQRHRIR
ncbi:MAG: hypothetical protein WCE61_00045 [Candidatus Acidiferrum sp.]